MGCGNGFGYYINIYGDDSDDSCGRYGDFTGGNTVVTTPCGRNNFDFGGVTRVFGDCGGQDQASSNIGVFSSCNGRGFGYPCGGVDYSNDCNGNFRGYGDSSSSSCGTRFGIYRYGSCDDSDDYCGGYGYLDCGNNVVTTPCGRNNFDYGCGARVFGDCNGQDQASSNIGVFSSCNGRGFGYPCGGIDYSNDCNGNFRGYGDSSSSPCDTRFGIYRYGSCDDSDDYCGGYGYLDCGSDVTTTPCGRNNFDFGGVTR